MFPLFRNPALALFCLSSAAVCQVRDVPAGASRFHMTEIRDSPQGVGGVAFRVLSPAAWRVEGGVIWRNEVANPAAPWLRLKGPTGQEIGILPPISFVWNPRLLGNRFRPGSQYLNMEVEPPLEDPFVCIQRVIVPRYRRNLVGTRMVKQELLPELAAAGRRKYPQPEYRNASFHAGKIRFEYNENGVEMEEDVYVLVASLQFPVGPTVSTLWAPDEIRYSKAPKGMLDQQIALFQTALFSFKPDLHWWAKVEQVSTQLARQQMQTSNSVTANSMAMSQAMNDRMAATRRSIASAGDQINSMIMNGYKQRQATMDNINARWDRTIREVEVYRNPSTGENVELPSGYGSGWINKSGDYLMTDLNSNPNSASNGSWTMLDKAPQ